MAGAPWVVASALAQPAPLHARIKVDTERVIGDIDPKIYGNFIEHLGRCIEAGVFDERSPLSDSTGFRKDVLAAAKSLNVSVLRWPGGNFSSNYHWIEGIGPRDNRQPRLEMAWGTVENNHFGTHEFMKYVETLGAEPYFCANLGTETWTEAQQPSHPFARLEDNPLEAWAQALRTIGRLTSIAYKLPGRMVQYMGISQQ
jgi:hypothetical protein